MKTKRKADGDREETSPAKKTKVDAAVEAAGSIRKVTRKTSVSLISLTNPYLPAPHAYASDQTMVIS